VGSQYSSHYLGTGLVRFAERRNLVSARVSSHFKRSLTATECALAYCLVHGSAYSPLARNKALRVLLITTHIHFLRGFKPKVFVFEANTVHYKRWCFCFRVSLCHCWSAFLGHDSDKIDGFFLQPQSVTNNNNNTIIIIIIIFIYCNCVVTRWQWLFYM